MENVLEITITVDLPEEIITEILLRLPVRSLLRFKCLSKSWLFLISSYKFSLAHLKISTKNNLYTHDKLIFGSKNLPMDLYTCSIPSIITGSNSVSQVYPTTNANSLFNRVRFDCPFAEPDDTIWIIGSCNGLVCVNLSPNIFILWNPTTRKSKKLPDSQTDLDFEYISITYAFGYDELHDDYKVVEFLGVMHEAGVYEIQVKVYSLRTNSWKILLNWPGGDTFGGSGKFLNGAIHWSVCDFERPTVWVIVSHDLATGRFIELPIPDLGDGRDDVRVEVKILKGCLAVCCEQNVHMDVWVMKEYGIRKSWTKLVRIPFLVDLREDEFFIRPSPLFFSEDGKALINYGTSLDIYDLSNPQSHEFSNDMSIEATTYSESLVSPNLDDEIIIGRTLPPEVITEILLRLPVVSLCRFKSVSKEWLSLISSTRFVQAHLTISTTKNKKLLFGPRTHAENLYTCSISSIIEGSVFADQEFGCFYSVDDDDEEEEEEEEEDEEKDDFPFESVHIYSNLVAPDAKITLVGSCNGLVCLSLSCNIIILLNPATSVSKIIAKSGMPDSFFKSDNFNCSYSFGYDEVHVDYKVVEFISFEIQMDGYISQIKVYSMRTNTWKTLSSWAEGYNYIGIGKFLNGSLHWPFRDFDVPIKWVIASYDLATETFARLPLPEDLDNVDDNSLLEVEILGGCLAVCCTHNLTMRIWLMKEYGIRESWSPTVRIPFVPGILPHRFVKPHPFYLSEDGKVLMNYGSSLRIYDSTNPQFENLETHSVVDAITYVESLVSVTSDEEHDHFDEAEC